MENLVQQISEAASAETSLQLMNGGELCCVFVCVCLLQYFTFLHHTERAQTFCVMDLGTLYCVFKKLFNLYAILYVVLS